MIERYTRPAMGRIWSEAAKYQAWLRVEIAACEAYARRGRIPAAVMPRIRALRVDIDRILAIQDRVKHEMIALLTSIEEQLGDDSRFVHIGLTTNDVWDTATALQMRDALDLLLQGQERLRRALGALAVKHKDTLIVGRTHGVHAEPTTFGLKAAVWYVEAGRNLERLYLHRLLLFLRRRLFLRRWGRHPERRRVRLRQKRRQQKRDHWHSDRSGAFPHEGKSLAAIAI